MGTLRTTLTQAELQARLLARLADGRTTVVWKSLHEQLLLDLRGLKLLLGEGWLAIEFLATPAGASAEPVQLVFWLGKEGEGDGPNATVTTTRAPSAAQERWLPTLRRMAWDAVLDCIEEALIRVERNNPGKTLTLLGFQVTGTGVGGTLAVDIAAA